MELIDRQQLLQDLKRFQVPYSDRMLQHALKGVGLRPAEYEGIKGGGKRAKYDPIDALVLATAYHGRIGAWDSPDVKLTRVANLYDFAIKVDGAGDIPRFASDREFGMKILYITSLDQGLPVERMIELLDADPGLIEFNTIGDQFLHVLLSAYKSTLGQELASRPMPTSPEYVPVSKEARQKHYVERLIEWAGGIFRLLAANE